jgi:hypothetical protein
MFSNMPRRTFNQMRHAFRHRFDIDSEYVMIRQIALLAGLKPIKYDCCINHCIAYTGKYELRQKCPFCNAPRFNRNRKARRHFTYLPLIPRLQSFYQSESMIDKLSYRHHYKHQPDRIADIFDSSHYHGLLKRKVIVDGVERPYTFFSNRCDIALALSVDGYLIFRRRRSGPSAIPILVQNYNLPPQIRTHLENLICLGIVHNPKDLTSYLAPLDDELVKLAIGVRTFDASNGNLFDLRAYAILEHGDMVAIEMMLGLKGHNGYRPCRSCKITGVRDISANGKTYYVPLITPDVDHQTRPSMDPRVLPLRTHCHHLSALQKIKSATKMGQIDLAKFYGIRHHPIIHRVSSIDFSKSFPWEWMHILCENVIPNMVDLWQGNFKGLDVGVGSYEIPPHIWKEIGKETANATKDIPSSYIRVLGNIVEDRSRYTAESWAFWFMYIAPIVLNGRFEDEKYYNHMCLLVKIMKKTLQFELTLQEIDEMENDIITWVQQYEEQVF